MKTLKLICLVFATVLVFTSCKKSDSDYPQWQSFATVRTLPGGSYHFQLENGKTMFVGQNHINGYPAKEGQRAAIYYNYLDQKQEGFDYNISLYALTDILTKDVKIATSQAELDALGKDGINVSAGEISIGNEYLTLAYYVPRVSYSEVHEFNLAVSRFISSLETAQGAADDYTDVQLCHNASGQIQEYSSLSFISFKLNDIHPRVTGKKGLRIHVKKLSGELATYQVDYRNGEEELLVQ